MFPLPLPFPEALGLRRSVKISRAVRRRIATSYAWRSWANDGVNSLNSLAGCSQKPCVAAASAAQSGSLANLSNAYKVVGKPPSDFCAAGAFTELCGKALPYISDGSGPAPYEQGNVSLPDAVDRILDVDQFLRDGNSDHIVSKCSSMLCSADVASEQLLDSGILKPHVDPAFNCSKVYGAFLRDMSDRHLLSWHHHSKSFLGLFFVRKKNGKLRLALDTRVANCQFSFPLHHSPHPGGLCRHGS